MTVLIGTWVDCEAGGGAVGVLGSPVSVRPLICNASAVLMNVGSASCLTLTSPQYMNWIRSLRAACVTSFKNTIGVNRSGNKTNLINTSVEMSSLSYFSSSLSGTELEKVQFGVNETYRMHAG